MRFAAKMTDMGESIGIDQGKDECHVVDTSSEAASSSW
jgi:hypothetical protein